VRSIISESVTIARLVIEASKPCGRLKKWRFALWVWTYRGELETDQSNRFAERAVSTCESAA
jgi:hypothetical protein